MEGKGELLLPFHPFLLFLEFIMSQKTDIFVVVNGNILHSVFGSLITQVKIFCGKSI